MITIIGCGGIGAWLASVMARSCRKPETLMLVDGDNVEEKNLDRQFFTEKHIGLYKVVALEESISVPKLTIKSIPQFIDADPRNPATRGVRGSRIIFCCPDNHAARAMSLFLGDKYVCPVILAGNSTWDADATYYHPDWHGTKLDPRVKNPEINLSAHGRTDPCTGDAQIDKPQLAGANFLAASMAFMLWQAWHSDIAPECMEARPVSFYCNGTAMRREMYEPG